MSSEVYSRNPQVYKAALLPLNYLYLLLLDTKVTIRSLIKNDNTVESKVRIGIIEKIEFSCLPLQKRIKTTSTYYYYSYYKINQLKQIIPLYCRVRSGLRFKVLINIFPQFFSQPDENHIFLSNYKKIKFMIINYIRILTCR